MACTLTNEQIKQTIAFHGHWCPGLAIGIRAAEWALINLCARAEDEELVAVVETDMCGVDAIQYLTGCTFGKGNLIHKDYGKNAFTFYRRSDGRSARLILESQINAGDRIEITRLYQLRQHGKLKPEEESRLTEIKDRAADRYMQSELEEIFAIQPDQGLPPQKARIQNSIVCDGCGELAMETRTQRIKGKILCAPCFQQQEPPEK